MIRTILTTLSLSLLASSAFATVNVDLPRYTGKWYEVASTKPFFQASCTCTEVRYGINESNNATVENMCRKGSPEGPIDYIKGEAMAANYPGLFTVTFGGFPAYFPNYQILDIADDYTWAIVSSPAKWPIWILSRTEKLPSETINAIKAGLQKAGYNGYAIVETQQDQCPGRWSAMDSLRYEKDLSTLVSLIEAAELAETLESLDALTVFAPTNEAFAKLDKKLVQELLADKEKLQTVLLSHLLGNRKDVQSLQGIPTTISNSGVNIQRIDNEVFVNDSKIIDSNFGFKNGIMHKIDAVIL